MLSSEKFNFVKAAADAQQVIMKDLKETRHDDHRREDRRRDDPRSKGGGGHLLRVRPVSSPNRSVRVPVSVCE